MNVSTESSMPTDREPGLGLLTAEELETLYSEIDPLRRVELGAVALIQLLILGAPLEAAFFLSLFSPGAKARLKTVMGAGYSLLDGKDPTPRAEA